MTAPLIERFVRQLPAVVRLAVDRFAAEVPYYGLLPGEVLDGEITEFAEQNYRIFVRALGESRSPTEAELAGPLIAVSRRAHEEIPLPAILAVYHVAARVGLEVLQEVATPAEMDQVLFAAQQVQRYLQLLIPAVTAVYLEEREGLHAATREARRALFDALINGHPFADAAERASVTLASSYTVLHLHLPESVENTVLARRRAHRIQDILDAHAREPVLTSLDGRGGTILLPATGCAESLLAPFSEVAGSPVTLGVSDAVDPSAIAGAADEARELVVLALRLGRAPGLYRLTDLLVEYQLSRPGRARDCLAAVVEPLADQPHLQQALDAYLKYEHGRQRAANSIHVHPNTLDYRLRRVAELTGLDPAQPSAARKLAAALLAAKTS